LLLFVFILIEHTSWFTG